MKFEFEEEAVLEAKVLVKERTKTFLKLPQTTQEMVLATAIDYEALNQQEKLLKARRDKVLRPVIESAADDYGIEDQNGHIHLVMDINDREAEVVRTKKISRILNSVAAEDILKKANLYETCITQVVSWEIDEEKVIEAYNAGLLSAADLDDMFTEKVTWATKVITSEPQVADMVRMRKELESQVKAGTQLPEITSE